MAAEENTKTSDTNSNLNEKGHNGDLSDVIVALLVSLILYAGLIWFSYSYNDGRDRAILILTCIAGIAFGWIVGILVSPYDQGEKKSFSEFGKIVYGFLSGYVVSKVDPLLNNLVGLNPKFDLNPHFIVILVYGIASFAIAIALTYISRCYWKEQRDG